MRSIALLWFFLIPALCCGESLTLDLRDAATTRGWRGLHDMAPLERTADGLMTRSTGDDPYLATTPLSVPDGRPLILTMRARSRAGGSFQVFYYADGDGPSEGRSVRFSLPGGDVQEISVALPPLTAKTRFRFDPPLGETFLERVTLEPRLEISDPPLPQIGRAQVAPTGPELEHGTSRLAYSSTSWNHLALSVGGKTVAAGHPRPLVGYRQGDQVRWLDINEVPGRTQTERTKQTLTCVRHVTDPDGGAWTFRHEIAPGSLPGTFDLGATVACDQAREIVFVPLLLVCPGLGTFGQTKAQGLFAGVEYLDHDPSRSEADVRGPGAARRVPAAHKVTFPLMAIHHDNTWSSLIWHRSGEVAPLFDSPDRTCGSGAHLMGLIAPGPDPNLRTDGDLFPFRPGRLEPNQPLTARATLAAGEGASVVPAIETYVASRGGADSFSGSSSTGSIASGGQGLSPLPEIGDPQAHLTNAARGWLDTPIRDGDRFRHALPGETFAAHPAADAAWMMEQLAHLSKDVALSQRLRETADSAWKAVEGRDLAAHRVGHLTTPVAPLLRGEITDSLRHSRERAEAADRRFDPEGRILYTPRPDKDYSTTHWSKEANGLAAQVVAQFLEDAAFSGNQDLIARAIGRLRGLDEFARTVPRGAQTWEIPLHTPDILAAAHLTRAYVLGWELTGEKPFLESARYWAWTGVPFVYLENPTPQPIGPYATIAVLGATNWEAPLWIGLPVQWCGLCYADSLLRLAPHDGTGPWRHIAEGIARSGLQQTYPADHPRHGLLPDSFTLDIQQRNIFDINPGTLHPVAMAAVFGQPPYSLTSLDSGKLLIHAAGRVVATGTPDTGVHIGVVPSFPGPSRVLIHGCSPRAKIQVDGREKALQDSSTWIAESQTWVLTVTGKADIEIQPGE